MYIYMYFYTFLYNSIYFYITFVYKLIMLIQSNPGGDHYIDVVAWYCINFSFFTFLNVSSNTPVSTGAVLNIACLQALNIFELRKCQRVSTSNHRNTHEPSKDHIQHAVSFRDPKVQAHAPF